MDREDLIESLPDTLIYSHLGSPTYTQLTTWICIHVVLNPFEINYRQNDLGTLLISSSSYCSLKLNQEDRLQNISSHILHHYDHTDGWVLVNLASWCGWRWSIFLFPQPKSWLPIYLLKISKQSIHYHGLAMFHKTLSEWIGMWFLWET